MIKKELRIINKLGLHARAAMQLSKLAKRYQSNIIIQHQTRKIDAKDILDLMALGARSNSLIEITISGEDENDAMQAIETLITNHFNEDE